MTNKETLTNLAYAVLIFFLIAGGVRLAFLLLGFSEMSPGAAIVTVCIAIWAAMAMYLRKGL